MMRTRNLETFWYNCFRLFPVPITISIHLVTILLMADIGEGGEEGIFTCEQIAGLLYYRKLRNSDAFVFKRAVIKQEKLLFKVTHGCS